MTAEYSVSPEVLGQPFSRLCTPALPHLGKQLNCPKDCPYKYRTVSKVDMQKQNIPTYRPEDVLRYWVSGHAPRCLHDMPTSS